ncbi:superoxide dismutase family protein [Microvirga massiliensis]|uniref:superoxide dismutase family protein n=1 Tax=Microvirga massiliensis TaxID=1033741 RepID=UPI00069BA8FD|nr:superoxide dismutase family protein [Microvirga massiliensis]
MKKAGVLLGSIVLAGQCLAQVPGIETRQAQLIGAHGKPIGTVVLRGSANATIVRITVEPGGLAPGWHGVHFHMTGDCSDIGEFMRARGIVDHVVKSHGLLHPAGPQEGDLPNIYANPDGSANAEMSSHAVRMLGQTGLVEGDGSALVIHAQEDDHTSQPLGNSGARVACAVLK